MKRQLDAICVLKGNREYRDLKGLVLFYEDLVKISISNFPVVTSKCNQSIVGIHIHEGNVCNKNMIPVFDSAKGHYNPDNCNHPYHAGDLGNLFINKDGSALMIFKNDRFKVNNIIGRTVILHSKLDDFSTQPTGASGDRIACGIIKKFISNND